ncbi:MAG TPA: T9SS type A sorting domain-containing protein [Candidatus Kapabacteria bacterium]|nr:T9SS type A sorting domain-containing protein [Candidatus Kapabacteria bacterium]
MRTVVFVVMLVTLLAEASFGQLWTVKAPGILPPFYNRASVGGLGVRSGGGIFFEHGKLWASPQMNGDEPVGAPILISKDTGKTWVNVTVPFKPGGGVGNISFCNQFLGAIVAAKADALCITNDGGITWARTSFFFYSDHVEFVAPNRLAAKVWVSSDQGNTFVGSKSKNLGGGFCFGRDNFNNLYLCDYNSFDVSSDSGITWTRYSPPTDIDSWSLTGHKSCFDSIIYVANEDTYGYGGSNLSHNHMCDIFVSTDGGRTFQSYYKAFSPDDRLSGTIIAAKRGVAYAATFNGVIMTTDFGKTWNNIGGPVGLLDGTSLAMIDDSTLVALDTTGSVYMCSRIPVPKPRLVKPVIDNLSLANISSCDSAVGVVNLQHQFCSPFFVTKLSMSGSTAPQFSVKLPQTPDTLSQNGILTIPVSFNPNKQVGSFAGGVKVSGFYLDDGDTVRIDTILSLSAATRANGPNLIQSTGALHFDTLSTCGTYQDTIITLTNKGCDTLRIISGPNGLAPVFTMVSPITLPVVLPQDSSITLLFRFKPSGSGYFNSTISFIDSQQTKTGSVSFTLEGNGIKEGGVFAYYPKTFDFKSLSICDSSKLSGWIANTGCDSLSLDSSKYFGDADFGVSGLGSGVWKMPPGDTTYYTVTLNPARKGIRTGFLVLSETDFTGTHRDSIPVSVTVTKGTSILSSSLSGIDFGTTTLCSERDTVIVLHNTGCYDSVLVTGFGVSGMGFGIDKTFPLSIAPNDSVVIPVHTILDTSGGKTSNSETITFTYEADNTISPVTLTRSIRYPSQIAIRLSGTPQAFNQQEADFTITCDKLVPGIKELDFTLSYNSDLLEYKSSTSNYLVTTSDDHHFRITPINPSSEFADTTLATLRFTVYLTKDSTTPVTMSSVTLNGGDPNFSNCIASITAASSNFTYLFQCADHEIQEFMRTGVVRIASIKPNPASGEIDVTLLRPGITSSARLRLVDGLGRVIYDAEKDLSKPSEHLNIDVSNIASGLYFLTVDDLGARVTAEVAVSH